MINDDNPISNEAPPNWWHILRGNIRHIFDVKGEIDFATTAETIKKDVVFRGFNIWILMLSIIICSIGLNLNSTAIVIGAMLISPLMGPITGLGFAVGTFDKDLLIKALKNLLIALVISIGVSFLFFKVAPISLNQSELLSRTKPGVMDLLVATFGGFAGILAGARNVKTNVIPGVAIATALMPPLCTAGFGLATGNMPYFLGAFYLFFINSVFISLSAFLVIRYLKFPIASYVDMKTRNRVRWMLILFTIAISVPSVILYSNALRQSLFEFRANKFVSEVINSDHRHADQINIFYSDTSRQIIVWVYGKEFTNPEKDSLNGILPIHGLNRSSLVVHNMGDYEAYKRLFDRKDQEISQKTVAAEDLRNQLAIANESLEEYKNRLMVPEHMKVNMELLNQEAAVLFKDLVLIEYHIGVEVKDSNQKEKALFIAGWNSSSKLVKSQTTQLASWLEQRYKQQFESIRVIHTYEGN